MTIIPAKRGFQGLSSISRCTKPLRVQVPFQSGGLSGQLEEVGGCLGNGSRLILLSGFICTSVRRGLCSGVREPSCDEGGTKSCGLFSAVSWSMAGGVVLVCTSKAMRWASKTVSSATNCRVVPSLSEPQGWDPFCCLLPGRRLFPAASQAGTLEKSSQSASFQGAGCLVSTPTCSGHLMLWGTLYLRTPCVVGCSTGHPTVGLPTSWDTPNTRTLCPRTPFSYPPCPILQYGRAAIT